jgi:transposase
MGRCYSLHLRRRVVARVAAGQSRRGAAEDLEVSPSFSMSWWHAIIVPARLHRSGRAASRQRQARAVSSFPGRAREAEARHHHAGALRRA